MTYLSSQAPASMGITTVIPSGGSLLVGTAMNKYWASLFYYANPNTIGSGVPHRADQGLALGQEALLVDAGLCSARRRPCLHWPRARLQQPLLGCLNRQQLHLPSVLHVHVGPSLAPVRHAVVGIDWLRPRLLSGYSGYTGDVPGVARTRPGLL